MSVHIKKRELVIKNGRNRASRPKTFKTEEAAKKYAEENKLKNVKILNLQPAAKVGKYKIVE